MPDKKAYEVTVLKDYKNYHVLKDYIVISDRMPQASDLPLSNGDEVMNIRELHAEVVVK